MSRFFLLLSVAEETDFPLNEFTTRNSAASQAVGYGKTLMLWHMLRVELGDELFLEGVVAPDYEDFVLNGQPLPFADRGAVIVGRHPADPELAIGLIHVDGMAAMPGMIEKLPRARRALAA